MSSIAPMVSLPLAETVTIQHRTVSGTDAYGDQVWEIASEETVNAAVVPRVPASASASSGLPRISQPGSFAEDIEGVWEVAYGYTLYMAAGPSVLLTDYIVVRGAQMSVDMPPAVWQSPFSGAGGLEINVSRING